MRVIAHRGDSRKHGDNNMASFKSSVSLGVDGIEMDVCITKDDNLILHHNPVCKQTGVPINTRNLLQTDLLLEDVFREFRHTNIEFVLDVKDTRVYSNISRDIYELCIRYKYLDRCIIGSFNENHLRDLRNIEKVTGSKIRKAYITANMKEDLFSSVIDTYGITHIVLYKFQVNQDVVNTCRSKDIKVYIYTCNTCGLHKYMEALGCDGIISDTPGSFL